MNEQLPGLDPNDPISIGLARVAGDQLALLVAIKTLIWTHPHPEAWADALDQELASLQDHWHRFPDPGQYQTENRIEDWSSALRSRSQP